MRAPAFFNWSGGKDSALALWHAQQGNAYDVRALLTTVSAAHNRILMHGVRAELLQAQARALGLPLHQALMPHQPTMDAYNATMQQTVNALKAQGLTHALFGDIYLEDLRAYREQQLHAAGLQAAFPIWGRDTRALLVDFWQAGFKAVIVCVDESKLDASFAGRTLDAACVEAFPPGVDPCGENGEYHTFVYDAPNFAAPIPITLGPRERHTYPAPRTDNSAAGAEAAFWFCDLLPA
jgi:uncharacterized protein (TIGR00290 family)